MAEFYFPSEANAAEIAGQARAGAEQATAAGTEVSLVQLIFVPQDENCFAVYRAGSVAAVGVAGSLAGLQFDRVVPAEVVLPRLRHR